jgi:hypothetical protein
MYIPSKLIINEHTVKSSMVGKLLEKYPDIFKNHYDAEYLILIVFIFHEMLKGIVKVI